MKTYLTVYVDSKGAKPSEVNAALAPLGFEPTKGPHDYVYHWKDAKELKELIWFADKVHEALSKVSVLYKMETVG